MGHSIGKELRLERVEAEVKQQDVSATSGVARFRLVQIEKGRLEPTDDEIARIRAAIRKLKQPETPRKAALASKG